jgi:hypothetical protein
MILIGIVVTFLGFIISFAGLGLTSSAGGRMVFAVLGIAISLFGMLGVLNRHFVRNAIWRK